MSKFVNLFENVSSSDMEIEKIKKKYEGELNQLQNKLHEANKRKDKIYSDVNKAVNKLKKDVVFDKISVLRCDKMIDDLYFDLNLNMGKIYSEIHEINRNIQKLELEQNNEIKNIVKLK